MCFVLPDCFSLWQWFYLLVELLGIALIWLLYRCDFGCLSVSFVGLVYRLWCVVWCWFVLVCLLCAVCYFGCGFADCCLGYYMLLWFCLRWWGLSRLWIGLGYTVFVVVGVGADCWFGVLFCIGG